MKCLRAWDRERAYSPIGSQEEPVFAFDVNEDGDEELIEVGKTNIYEKIQTYKDGVLLENVVKRCVASGDWTPLQAPVFYGDDSVLPKDMLELKQFEQKAGELYANLSAGQKDAFEQGGVDALIKYIQDSNKLDDVAKLKSLEAEVQALKDKGVKYE